MRCVWCHSLLYYLFISLIFFTVVIPLIQLSSVRWSLIPSWHPTFCQSHLVHFHLHFICLTDATLYQSLIDIVREPRWSKMSFNFVSCYFLMKISNRSFNVAQTYIFNMSYICNQIKKLKIYLRLTCDWPVCGSLCVDIESVQPCQLSLCHQFTAKTTCD